MNLTDPIADMLTRIRNANSVNKATVSRTLLRAKKVLNDKSEDLRQEDLREHPNRLDLAEPETARYVLSRLTVSYTHLTLPTT